MDSYCYNLSNISLSVVEDNFLPKPVRSEEKDAAFRKICDVLDPFIKDGGINGFAVDVDPETMEIHLELVLPGVWE